MKYCLDFEHYEILCGFLKQYEIYMVSWTLWNIVWFSETLWNIYGFLLFLKYNFFLKGFLNIMKNNMYGFLNITKYQMDY